MTAAILVYRLVFVTLFFSVLLIGFFSKKSMDFLLFKKKQHGFCVIQQLGVWITVIFIWIFCCVNIWITVIFISGLL